MPEFDIKRLSGKIAGKRNRLQAEKRAVINTRRVRARIVPTIINGSIYNQEIDSIQKVYDTLTLLEDKYLYKDYAMVKYYLFEALANCKPCAIRLFKLIYAKLRYTSNVISFTYKEAKDFNVGKYDIEINEAIENLVDKNIIFYTDIQSVYIINHSMYFKGDWDKFCRIYKEQYNDLPIETYYVPEEKKLYIKDIILTHSRQNKLRDVADKRNADK